jgi:hypothetical protein
VNFRAGVLKTKWVKITTYCLNVEMIGWANRCEDQVVLFFISLLFQFADFIANHSMKIIFTTEFTSILYSWPRQKTEFKRKYVFNIFVLKHAQNHDYNIWWNIQKIIYLPSVKIKIMLHGILWLL